MWGRGVHVSEYIRSREEMLALLISGWGNSRYFLLLYTCLHFLSFFFLAMSIYYFFFIYYFYQKILEDIFLITTEKHRCGPGWKPKMLLWIPLLCSSGDLKTHHKTSTEVSADPEDVLVKVGLPGSLLEDGPRSLSFHRASSLTFLRSSITWSKWAKFLRTQDLIHSPFHCFSGGWAPAGAPASPLCPATHASSRRHTTALRRVRPHCGHAGLLGLGKAGSPHPGHLEYLIKGATGEAWLRDPENGVHPRAGSYLPCVGYELCNLTGGLFLQFLCL